MRVALGYLVGDADQSPLPFRLSARTIFPSSMFSFLASRDLVKGAGRLYQGDATGSVDASLSQVLTGGVDGSDSELGPGR